MDEHDLLRREDQARSHLKALRACLEDSEAGRLAPEIQRALDDLLEMLGRLHDHYELLREILTWTRDAVFAKDQDGRYVMINRNGAEMFGKSVEEIIGQDDTALFAPESAERIMTIDREVMGTGKPRTFEETFDILGVPTTLLTTQTAWYRPDGGLRGLIGTAQDVTERNRTARGAQIQQDRLRSMASEIVIAEERLRHSLAADLQNGLSQELALAKMKLSALRSTSSADLQSSLTQIESLVEQADRSLRAITLQLSPPALHDLGLVPALQWLAEDLRGRYDLEVRIEDDGDSAPVDYRMRVILFRAVRELLTNVAKHASAREASVRLASEDSLLRIVVADGGTGFDAERVSLQGDGLYGISEQLRHVGGEMHIDSVPGRGTTVTLTAPLTVAGAASI
jgi:PAS domain S-box-containing protein